MYLAARADAGQKFATIELSLAIGRKHDEAAVTS
jgi:hypothetical protein